MQNVVTNLGKGSRKALTDDLREFVKIDSERALEVKYLKLGMGKFKERRRKVPEGCPELTVRGSSDELTLRAEEVSTLNTYINVNHIEEKRWGLPLVDYEWYAEMYEAYKEMSRVVCVKKPQYKRPRKQKPSGK